VDLYAIFDLAYMFAAEDPETTVRVVQLVVGVTTPKPEGPLFLGLGCFLHGSFKKLMNQCLIRFVLLGRERS